MVYMYTNTKSATSCVGRQLERQAREAVVGNAGLAANGTAHSGLDLPVEQPQDQRLPGLCVLVPGALCWIHVLLVG